VKGSSIHVQGIDYTNTSFITSHTRISGASGVCCTDFNVSVSVALSPFSIIRSNRALCFHYNCNSTQPSGPGYVNATSSCVAPIYAYLAGAYDYWDSPPAIATGGCTFTYVPVLGREAEAMTAANYSRLLKDGLVLEWQAAAIGDCAACSAGGGSAGMTTRRRRSTASAPTVVCARGQHAPVSQASTYWFNNQPL
jgi:hypothetical protein